MSEMRAYLGPAAATVSIIFLGSSFVATRMIIADIEPALLAFIRHGIATLTLAPFLLFATRARIPLTHLPIFLLLGFLQYGFFWFLLNSGLQHIPASRGAVIFSLIPILTVAVAVAGRIERLTGRKVTAGVLAVAGVSIALGEKAFTAGAATGWTGEALFLAGVCCGATYNVLANRMLRRYPVLPFSTMVVFCGVLTLIPFVAVEGAYVSLPALDGIGWWVVLFLAVPAGAFSMSLFNWALTSMPASQAAVFVPLAPLTATFLGWLLLDEILTVAFLAGLACVVAGIWLANSRSALAADSAP